MTSTASQTTLVSTYLETLAEKIRTRTARVGVVGMGYVDLPLAVEYAKTGFTVTGIDVQASKIDVLNSGASYIEDVPTSEVAELVRDGKLSATTDFQYCCGTRYR